MNCNLCGSTDPEVVQLPIRRPNGSYITTACLACAQTNPAYCNKHETPHIGFEDDTHACTKCIEESVVSYTEPHLLLNRLVEGLDDESTGRLLEWASIATVLTGGEYSTPSILRAIFSLAFRTNKTPEEIVDTILEEQNISILIPDPS